MSMSDPIADFLTRIRNGLAAKKRWVDVPSSAIKKRISFVVFADDEINMIIQGNKIKSWGKNVYVKVPVANSKGKFMGAAIKSLNKNRVKLNITAVYTAQQTKKILGKIDKKTKTIISILKVDIYQPAYACRENAIVRVNLGSSLPIKAIIKKPKKNPKISKNSVDEKQFQKKILTS